MLVGRLSVQFRPCEGWGVASIDQAILLAAQSLSSVAPFGLGVATHR